jgi:hypothetical protein
MGLDFFARLHGRLQSSVYDSGVQAELS